MTVNVLLGRSWRALRQTILGTQRCAWSIDPTDVGNCFAAAVACLLELDSIDGVPHFAHLRNVAEYHAGIELPWSDWRLVREWLRAEHQLDIAGVDRGFADELDVPYIATIPSHRLRGRQHCVIARAGHVVWDPSGLDGYTDAELAASPFHADVLVEPYDPDPAAQLIEWRAADTEPVLT